MHRKRKDEYVLKRRQATASKEYVFYCEQRRRFIFRRLTFDKKLKMFVTEYILVVRFIIS